MDLPLYDQLSQSTDDHPPPDCEKALFVKRVKKFDQNGMEMLYALIYKHQTTTSPSQVIYPYEAKVKAKGKTIQFTMEIMPPKLQNIMVEFSKMHEKLMRED